MSREAYPKRSVHAYRVSTAVTWLVLVITAFYYTFNVPTEGKHHRDTIFGQNHRMHTPFALNPIIVSIYWIVLFLGQLGYSWHLYSENEAYTTAAANVGSHFVVNNLLLFGAIHLWVRSHFWLTELLLVVNFFNLSAAYFRHSATPRFIHIPVVSGPLAFNYVAIFTVGAAAVNAHTFFARITANIFIWSFLGYGFFFLVAYKDYTIGFELSILCAGELLLSLCVATVTDPV